MGRSDEGDVDLLTSQQFEKLAAESLLQLQRYLRVGLLKRANDARHERMKRACGHDPYADSAFLAPRRATSRFKRMIQLGEDSTGILEEGAPGIGQLDTARS